MGVFKNPRVLERTLNECDGAGNRTDGRRDTRTAGKATANASGEEETEKSD